jgi:hypothetical protein
MEECKVQKEEEKAKDNEWGTLRYLYREGQLTGDCGPEGYHQVGLVNGVNQPVMV